MSAATDLAVELRKICADHGVVLSHPLLKLLAQRALAKDDAAPGKTPPAPSSLKVPPGGGVKVSFAKKPLAEYSGPMHHLSFESPSSFQGSPYTKKIAIKGEYFHLAEQMKFSQPLLTTLGPGQMEAQYVAQKELLHILREKAYQKGILPIGEPYFELVKMQDPFVTVLYCYSHGIKPEALPSAAKPWLA